MSLPVNPGDVIRIPNLPNGNMTNDDGSPTAEEMNFRQTLITSLQNNFGPEGVVFPTQSAANITIIQNNFTTNPETGLPIYTCAYGTGLYNSDANSIMFAVSDGGSPPKPIFKTVTLT